MPDVNITVYVQAADILEQYEAKWKAEAELKRLADEERWLRGMLQSHLELKVSLYQHQGPIIADTWSSGASFAIEEVSRRLRIVQEEIKRVSNLSQGRDSLENNLMPSVAQLIQFNKEA